MRERGERPGIKDCSKGIGEGLGGHEVANMSPSLLVVTERNPKVESAAPIPADPASRKDMSELAVC